ncbi:MAG: hypothetical protein D6696_02980 [Acidobacteria bacterium]|nr:MAG: hypothetical protein D6696_02980 [Acidobacteriota bacterium]
MRRFHFRAWAAVLAVVLIAALPAGATTVLQMNLEGLCDGAAQIFRGTVLRIDETRVTAGGGEIPALRYTVRVDEALKGQFQTVKGVPIAEILVVGTLKQHAAGRPPIAGFPLLQEGREYLLMVAPAGPVGLTATMGLGQGCFTLAGKPGEETAVNGFNNNGLFAGMTVPGMPASGPVSYAALASMIQGIVGGGQ